MSRNPTRFGTGDASGGDRRAADQATSGANSTGVLSSNRRRFLQATAATGVTGALASSAASAVKDARVNAWDGFVDEDWTYADVSDGLYMNPGVVVTGPPSYEGTQPCSPRLRYVDGNSFDVKVEEWDYLNGTHYHEEVHALHFETGAAMTDDGEEFEGKIVQCSDYDWTYVDFKDSFFDVTPVVLSNVQTHNGAETVVTRHDSIDTSGFWVKMQEQEDRTTDDGDSGVTNAHKQEDVGILAIEPSPGSMGPRLHEAGTVSGVDENWTTINFDRSYVDPIFVADLQTWNGSDPCGLRYRNLTSNSVEVKLQEEQSKDDETGHTTETVGYLVVEDKTLHVGERDTRRQDVMVGDASDNLNMMFDFNWGLGTTYHNDDSYRLGASGLLHTYIHDEDGSHYSWDCQDDLRIHASLDADSTNTTLSMFQDLSAVIGWNDNLNAQYQWGDWYREEKGSYYEQSQIEQKLKEKDFEDPDAPAWVDVMTFLGGAAASVIPGGAVLGLGSQIVGGMLLADKLTDLAFDNCDIYHDDSSPHSFTHEWCFCNNMALSIYSLRIDVNVATDQESGPVTLNLTQIVDPDDSNQGTWSDHINNEITWKVKFPLGGGLPWIADVTETFHTDTNCG